ncbi:MAG: glycosyltransferase family 2 protein [Fibromonadales bacterium]|nr:glycosyltransferase family 2 protein [Fibromonadales bacterium]
MKEIHLVALIPVYNHWKALHEIAEILHNHKIACIFIDDCSNENTKQHLKSVCENFKMATLVTRKENGGKGAAVMDGLTTANNLGYTHALQIDADAQHDLSAIPVFLQAMQNNPEHLIAGFPVYDSSAPKSRTIARRITNFWVAIETLSMSINDSMCGFRIYPVAKCCNLINNGFWTFRMGFDVEVFVRLHWLGVPFLFLPVNVFYYKDNVSNFRLFRDNLEISKLHTLLFFGMLFRIPMLLRRKICKK